MWKRIMCMYLLSAILIYQAIEISGLLNWLLKGIIIRNISVLMRSMTPLLVFFTLHRPVVVRLTCSNRTMTFSKSRKRTIFPKDFRVLYFSICMISNINLFLSDVHCNCTQCCDIIDPVFQEAFVHKKPIWIEIYTVVVNQSHWDSFDYIARTI